MANNQQALTFVNLNNNLSLSQNKWSDTFLHKNKSCRYNNLMSPLWKKKENFSGAPFVDGSNIYTIKGRTLYKNRDVIATNIPDGWSYDILDYDCIEAFPGYIFTDEKPYSGITVRVNQNIVELPITKNYAGIKIIEIPTKTGFAASFGILTITKDSPFMYIWYSVHFRNDNTYFIENTSPIPSYATAYSSYMIIGGLITTDGSWAGFSVFKEAGWVNHDKTPPEFCINLNDLSQGGAVLTNNLTVTNSTDRSLWQNLVRVYSLVHRITPDTWDYFNAYYYYDAVEKPKTHFYFCKNRESGISIRGNSQPLYGFEMWIQSKEQLYNSSIQIGNTIKTVSFSSNQFSIDIESTQIYMPHSCYAGSHPNSKPLGTGFFTGNLSQLLIAAGSDTSSEVSWAFMRQGFQLNIASSSFITPLFQENLYAGYHKTSDKEDLTGNGAYISNTDVNFCLLSITGTSAMRCKSKPDLVTTKSFDTLNPGDDVRDENPFIHTLTPFLSVAYSVQNFSDQFVGIQNVITNKGNAILQWNNIKEIHVISTTKLMGKFLDNDKSFIIHQQAPVIVGKMNNYLLVNSDSKNALNTDTLQFDKVWSIGYNSTLFRNYNNYTVMQDLNAIGVSSLPILKTWAGSVNNHPETTNDYFSASDFPPIHGYSFEDLSVGNNPYLYDIELYEGTGANPEYKNSTREQSNFVYTNVNLSGQAYQYTTDDMLYSYFLANFSFEYFFNRFGIIRLGNDLTANLRYLNSIYQTNQYNLKSVVEGVENVFIIMGQIYFIIKGFIFAVTLNNEFTISYQAPITECKNLIFCGNTSKKAIFFSPITKELFVFTGNQIFERLQEASEIQDIMAFKNCYYLNLSLISYVDNNGNNNVLLLQDERSSLFFTKKDFDDIQLEDGDVNAIAFGNDIIYLTTTEGITYSVAFFQKDNTYTPLEIIFETETMLGNFSQNVIDCIYVNAKKEKGGKVKLTIRSGINEDSYNFDLDKIKVDINGFVLLRYQPKNQQRGRVAIRLEGNVPIEDIAYSTRPIGNEISHPKIEI